MTPPDKAKLLSLCDGWLMREVNADSRGVAIPEDWRAAVTIASALKSLLTHQGEYRQEGGLHIPKDWLLGQTDDDESPLAGPAPDIAAIKAELAQPSPSVDARPCTCHPADNPPQPCAEKYAFSECIKSDDQCNAEELATHRKELAQAIAQRDEYERQDPDKAFQFWHDTMVGVGMPGFPISKDKLLELAASNPNAELVEALRFYADEYQYTTWIEVGTPYFRGPSIYLDNGERARKALTTHPKTSEQLAPWVSPKLEHYAEEYECAMKVLDDHGVPRESLDHKTHSLVGRIDRYHLMAGEKYLEAGHQMLAATPEQFRWYAERLAQLIGCNGPYTDGCAAAPPHQPTPAEPAGEPTHEP